MEGGEIENGTRPLFPSRSTKERAALSMSSRESEGERGIAKVVVVDTTHCGFLQFWKESTRLPHPPCRPHIPLRGLCNPIIHSPLEPLEEGAEWRSSAVNFGLEL